MRLLLSWLPICFLLFPAVFTVSVSAPSPDDPTYHVVKLGDTLYEIAADLGNKYGWVKIYQANKNKINDPDLIYPGQRLKIPSSLVNTKTASLKSDSALAKTGSDSLKPSRGTSQKKMALEAFRKAFDAVVDKQDQKEKQRQKKQTDRQMNEGLGLGGMVLDETRTKMGRDFYSIFYKHWEAPRQARNFTITISEQPVPSRGTMVNIEINDQLVYRNRLEPRYYKTQKKARQAVSICQRKLLRLVANQNELNGY